MQIRICVSQLLWGALRVLVKGAALLVAHLPGCSLPGFVSPQARPSMGRLAESKTARNIYWKWVEPTVPEAGDLGIAKAYEADRHG